MTQLHDDLVKLADFLEGPGRWTQGAYSRDKDGNNIGLSIDGASYCIVGAVDKLFDPDDVHYKAVMDALYRNIPNPDLHYLLSMYNDAQGRTQEEVVAFIREVANNTP